MERRRIFVRLDDCMGCLTCELSCASSHDPALSRLEVEAKDSKPVPVLCRHCEDAPCVEACMSGAMRKDPETGLIINVEENCTGCFMCVLACPYGVIFTNGKKKVYKCDLCFGKTIPMCVESCPMEVLQFKTPEEFSSEVRKDALKNLIT